MSLPKKSVSPRDISVDVVRGISIITMIAANLAGVMALNAPPMSLRLFGTFAAPLFIFLSGMMVYVTCKRYPLSHYMIRFGMIWTVALFIDWVLEQHSFSSIDVLWLIGLSLPLCYLFLTKISSVQIQLIVIALIFAITPLLQAKLGYIDDPETPFAFDKVTLKHWIIDGWFPLFPWIGFSFLGGVFAHYRTTVTQHKYYGLVACLILFAGVLIWYFFFDMTHSMSRDGYSELFYPPTIGYMITAIGVIGVLFYLVQLNPALKLYRAAIVLGEASLFMYILQYTLEALIIHPYVASTYPNYMLSFVALLMLLIVVGYGLRYLKSRWTKRPYVIKFLIG